ncbi:hypothetical protein CERZMDRAFT_83124 [Cercospora zeae-maydis SCOH1-5]|uniref:Uncharacterized protein n=1 Tax=Cercospora zeae-maydis SCOH1-5 TaxID=717836 RepID=A0A6A6FM07_9PEZI|nr:hypothetical protein CERZMDRAFT_83124 [Cercospora zeae-maydis SCOH1-5]
MYRSSCAAPHLRRYGALKKIHRPSHPSLGSQLTVVVEKRVLWSPYTISPEVTVLRRTEAGLEFCFFACNTEQGLIVLEEVLHLATRRLLRVTVGGWEDLERSVAVVGAQGAAGYR